MNAFPTHSKALVRFAVMIVGSSIIGACGGADTTAPPAVVLTLSISNAPTALWPGQNAMLTATVMGGDGQVFNDGVVTWVSSNPAVAAVAATGKRTATLTALSAGEAKISATLEGRSTTVGINIGAAVQTEVKTAAFIYTEQDGMVFIPLPSGVTAIEALAVNDSGQVVGEVSYGASSSHAFLWSRSDGMTDLGGLPGGSHSAATAISQNGQVAGWGNVSDAHAHAFRWTRATGMVDLGVPSGAVNSFAAGINSSGQVVGWSQALNGALPFRWTEERGMESISSSGTVTFGLATAINEAGQVAGALSLPGDPYPLSYVGAIMWTASGVRMDVANCPPLSPECDATALAINGNGVVAGTDGTHAFTWTSDGGIRAVPGLPSGTDSEATGINDKGNVVGNVYSPENVGFLWSAAGGYATLPPPPGRTFIHLSGINNRDEVVGFVQ